MTTDRSWRVRVGLVVGVVSLLAWGAAVGTARGRHALGLPALFEREAPSRAPEPP